MKEIQNKNPLKAVQKKFKYWRKTRKYRENIPEKLWKSAVSLSESYSINQISQTLRLNYQALKNRVGNQALKREKNQQSEKNKFVELEINRKLFSGTEKKIEIEIIDVRGWKIKLCGENIEKIIEATQAIWKGDL